MRRYAVLGCFALVFGVVLALPLLPGQGRPPMVSARPFINGHLGARELMPLAQARQAQAALAWHTLAYQPFTCPSPCGVIVLRQPSLASGQFGHTQILPMGKDGRLYNVSQSAVFIGHGTVGALLPSTGSVPNTYWHYSARVPLAPSASK